MLVTNTSSCTPLVYLLGGNTAGGLRNDVRAFTFIVMRSPCFRCRCGNRLISEVRVSLLRVFLIYNSTATWVKIVAHNAASSTIWSPRSTTTATFFGTKLYLVGAPTVIFQVSIPLLALFLPE